MNIKIYRFGSMILAGLLSVGTAARASDSCGPPLTNAYEQARAVIGSLRADKPGQMRVLADDGSVYTSGQAQWLRGQLHDVLIACERGQFEAAKRGLSGIHSALDAKHIKADNHLDGPASGSPG